MKTSVFITIAVVILFAFPQTTWSQANPTERKALREHVSPQELVSIAPTTPLDKALSIISEVSRRFVGKVVVDTERRTMPINIDIQGMQWRDALEAICRKNSLWYTEYDGYIQITGVAGENGDGTRSSTTGGSVQYAGIQSESPSFRSREVKISAYFFEVNLSRVEEVGINWEFMKSTKDFSINANMKAGDKVTDKIFSAGFTPKISFANIHALANMFSEYDMGEILAGPSVIVRSGEEGRIQVGADFSIKERDFAGNVIDKFYSAGTIIKVKPQVINEQGVSFIHMNLEAEKSDVTPGTISTIIAKTKANTNLLLLDGEETVIGGLYSSQTSTVRTGIPFLKDLPWYVLGLRYLFGYNKEELKKKELIILLKAELVPTLQERISQKARQEKLFDKWESDQQRMERKLNPPE